MKYTSANPDMGKLYLSGVCSSLKRIFSGRKNAGERHSGRFSFTLLYALLKFHIKNYHAHGKSQHQKSDFYCECDKFAY